MVGSGARPYQMAKMGGIGGRGLEMSREKPDRAALTAANTVVAAALASALPAGLWGRRGRGKPRLKLVQWLGAFPRPTTSDISPLFVFFTVANAGETEATIAELWVEPRGGSLMAIQGMEGERDLPCTLAPGQETRFWVRAKGLARALDEGGYGGRRPKVKLVVVDSLGDRHEKRFGFRVDQYLALKDE